MISAPVQVIPPGLLGFLNLKNNGVNPNELPSTIQSTLDLRNWMFLARQVTFGLPNTSTRAFVTAGRGWFNWTTQPITVPDREAWYVRAYAVNAATLAVGDSIAFRAAWSPKTTGSIPAYALGSDRVVTTAGNTGIVTSGDFFLPPGAQLGVYIDDCTSAGGVNLFANVEYTPLPL